MKCKCPIPGCGYEFATGRTGWHIHVGMRNKHPQWHPKVTGYGERTELFKKEFPAFFTPGKAPEISEQYKAWSEEHKQDIQRFKSGMVPKMDLETTLQAIRVLSENPHILSGLAGAMQETLEAQQPEATKKVAKRR